MYVCTYIYIYIYIYTYAASFAHPVLRLRGARGAGRAGKPPGPYLPAPRESSPEVVKIGPFS